MPSSATDATATRGCSSGSATPTPAALQPNVLKIAGMLGSGNCSVGKPNAMPHILLLAASLLASPAPAPAALETLHAQVPAASHAALEAGLSAWRHAVASGAARRTDVLTVIDYSRPSTEPRLFVLDVPAGRVRFAELVAHGRGSGENATERFSNASGSRMTSLGVFRAADTYDGQHGLSLRLDGLEPGFNDRARERAIVMHGAAYVNSEMIAAQGRLGRSWGCPAVRPAIAKKLIEMIKDGSLVVAYYPDAKWLARSAFLGAAPPVRTSRPADPS
jgi:L,D-transpeptidase catalytic domain